MSGLLPRTSTTNTATGNVSADQGTFNVLYVGTIFVSGSAVVGSIVIPSLADFSGGIKTNSIATHTTGGNLTVVTTGAGNIDLNGTTVDTSGTLSIASGADLAVNVIVDQGAGVTIACASSNTDITFDPAGTGRIVCAPGHTFLADTINPNTAGAITLASTSNGNVNLSPNGTGVVAVAAAKTLTADTITPTTAGAITIASTSNGNINLSPNGTGKVVLAATKTLGVDAITTTTTNGSLAVTTTGAGNISLNGALIDSGGTGITISTVTAPASMTLNAGAGTQHIFLNPSGSGTVQVNPGFSLLADTVSNSASNGALALTTRGGNANITITPNGSGVIVMGKGLQLPTSGGTVGTLDFYEQNTSQSLTFSGPIANSAVSVNCSRVGNIVALRCTSFSVAANGSTAALVSTAINSRFRPTADIRVKCAAISNSAVIDGIFQLAATGVITIATSSFGTLATTGNDGLSGDFTFAYPIV